MTYKILVADDDAAIRKLIHDILVNKGYEPILVKDGEAAIEAFYTQKDIVLCILDVMMPQYSGWEVLEIIKSKSDIPVLMLTALGDEKDEWKGLTMGADDYITKPFSYLIFTARVDTLLRKVKAIQETKWTLGKLQLDESKHTVYLDNKNIILNKKEFSLLSLFMKNPNQVFTRDSILDRIWGYDFDKDNRTVDAHIKMLRAKLGMYGSYIVTIRGIGYKMEITNEKGNTI